MNKARKIIWSYKSKESLNNIYEYIKNDSLQNAKKVKRRIVEIVSDLLIFPEKYSRGPFLDKTIGNFRFAVIWRYKIIYEITDNNIIILDIFHTAQSPIKITKLIEKRT